ncbi:hypothetical protein HK101_008147 [Irineochytrium annulatum]|nr:hypothetical protein HK101_008147 [Irineochytrium annulatum]
MLEIQTIRGFLNAINNPEKPLDTKGLIDAVDAFLKKKKCPPRSPPDSLKKYLSPSPFKDRASFSIEDFQGLEFASFLEKKLIPRAQEPLPVEERPSRPSSDLAFLSSSECNLLDTSALNTSTASEFFDSVEPRSSSTPIPSTGIDFPL